jgi:acylphosphatase
MSDIFTVHAVISGRVQGVGYRWFVERTANSQGINGWVRNMPGGGVEVKAEGEKAVLEGFLETLKSGHRGAEVEDIKEEWARSVKTHFNSFEITY